MNAEVKPSPVQAAPIGNGSAAGHQAKSDVPTRGPCCGTASVSVWAGPCSPWRPSSPMA
jgi:hypothetical protein